MASNKLQLTVLNIFLFVTLINCLPRNLFTIQLTPNNELNWERFCANVTVKVDYGNKVTTYFNDLPLDPFSWWSFDVRSNKNVDKINNITFVYSSNDSPNATFSMKSMEIGQHYFRNRYVYMRKFTFVNAPDWLEQNKPYVGVPLDDEDDL